MDHGIGVDLPMNHWAKMERNPYTSLIGRDEQKTLRKDPYFFFFNPVAARNEAEKWADIPRFSNGSLGTELHLKVIADEN